MQNEMQFAALSAYYDRLNGTDYKKYASFIEKTFKKHGSGKENLLLDLACGTGTLTCELASRGYDMIGADISLEMLNVARDRAYDSELGVLWLCQDMREFELYGTVDAIICSLDGISYLTDRESVLSCFKLVRNYLNPGALFIFDVNSVYRFCEILDGREYFIDDGDVCLGWHSEVNGDYCDFYLTLFTQGDDGRYSKRTELQSERVWARADLESVIFDSGLELVSVYSNFDMSELGDTDEKWYFVCRCPFEK